METADLCGLILFLVAGIFVSILIFLLFHAFVTKKISKVELNGLTILIPFKNEMTLLPNLISYLNKKIELSPAFSVWLLNDHSADLNAGNVKKLELNDQIKLIPPVDGITGKKTVWNEAIKHVKTDWVLIMDVDTVPPESIFTPNLRLIPHGVKCLLIPIIPARRKGLINSFFDLDFLSLHFAGLASANANKPLLANGACMLIERKAYLDSLIHRTDWSEPGGDDVFTMFAIAKTYGGNAISTLSNPNSFARVQFPRGLIALWRQRQRWISKSGRIKDSWFQFVSWTVLITQILFLVNLVFLFNTQPSGAAFLAASTVFIAEIIYLTFACVKLKRTDLWLLIIPAIFIYPFYLLALVIFGTFAKPKWK